MKVSLLLKSLKCIKCYKLTNGICVPAVVLCVNRFLLVVDTCIDDGIVSTTFVMPVLRLFDTYE